MKYPNFERNFYVTSETSDAHTALSQILSEPYLGGFINQYGGKSFNEGIYRVLSASQVGNWNNSVIRFFPEFDCKIMCFGIDWLGRVFAHDSTRLVDSLPGVVMFEPGTAQALEIPCNIVSFHEVELQEYRDAALAESFFTQWVASGGQKPTLSQCIGYKQPLFLGGKDEISNLHVSDLDVYWEIFTQIIRKIKKLPA